MLAAIAFTLGEQRNAEVRRPPVAREMVRRAYSGVSRTTIGLTGRVSLADQHAGAPPNATVPTAIVTRRVFVVAYDQCPARSESPEPGVTGRDAQSRAGT